jgi:Ni/Co efflux regulator RcnB
MKQAFAAAAAVAMALGLSAAAQAQPPDEHQAQHAPPPAPAPARPQGQPGQYRGPVQGQAGGQFRGPSGSVGVRVGVVVNGPHGAYAAGPGVRPQFRPGDQGRVQYSAQRFPRTMVFRGRFRMAERFYPSGWYARRWAYGESLPWGWFTPTFYLSWGNYGLPAPPIGCEWVQEGPDAVLVNIWTGQVLSVVPGIFY